MRFSIIFLLPLFILACSSPKAKQATSPAANEVIKEKTVTNEAIEAVASTEGTLEQIRKTPEQWQAELTEMEYYVLREKGTERSFAGDLWDNKKEGIYSCAACQLPLFHSETKFKSGTGWPSYYQAINKENVVEYTDETHGMTRVEVVCGRCDGHLGHIFNDGPKPTGLRYCINSVSLDFVQDNK
jgi:peptide-methionine (R)-S-oxide reductase